MLHSTAEAIFNLHQRAPAPMKTVDPADPTGEVEPDAYYNSTTVANDNSDGLKAGFSGQVNRLFSAASSKQLPC
jgi:hypothetical protein